MLKLKRVEVQGFKSFCERTDMRFQGSGLAAIVGPNGCGKSNMSDAISWVLGEQSAKSLRGTRMEDVIFAGTRERKPLGMAAVTLTLVDPEYHAEHDASTPSATPKNGSAPPAGTNGHAGAHPREITITRRLFRSGDSEYLIDGRLARLRDIQDLFMGTGLGPESYAIIEQGRIGQILSSKPQDRRSVIEEAAGISRFKAKKRLAEAKLEGSKQNLARVFDILEEVGRQANSLKRQAAKTKRFQEYTEQLRAELRRSLAGRFRLLEREAAKTALELNLATSECQKLAEQVAALEKTQAERQQKGYTTERGLTESRGRLAELRLEAERTRGRLELQARQIAAIEERLSQDETETETFETQLGVLAGELESCGRTLEEIERQAGEARQKLSGKSQERDALQESLRGRERCIEAGRQSVLRFLGEVSALRNDLAQIDGFLASLERDKTRTTTEVEASLAEQQRLEANRAELIGKLEAQQAELGTLTARRREVEEHLASRKQTLGESRRRLEELREETSRLKARKDSLEEILSHRAYTTESVKRLFGTVEQGHAGELQPLGVLADFVEVDAAYEKAAEEFLHDELEYVVVRDWSQADLGLNLMRTDLEGRATFLVHPPAGMVVERREECEPAIGPETGILGRLSDYLRLTNGLTKTHTSLLPRLNRCVLAEDREAAQRLAMSYPDFYFLMPDGVSYHGCAVSGGKKSAGGPLALKRELREMTGLVQDRLRQTEKAAASVELLEEELASLGDELEKLRAEQQEKEKAVVAAEHEQRKLAEELTRLNSRLSVARMELERLEREKSRSKEQRNRHAATVEEKEAARQSEEQKLEEYRRSLEQIQAQAARAVEEHSALRVVVAERDERLRAERATHLRLENQLRELRTRLEETAREMQRLGVERARLLEDNLTLDARAESLAGEIAQAEEAVNTLAAEETRLREELAGAEEELRQARLGVQTAREHRSQVEIAMAERRAELKYLEETSRKELGAPLDDLLPPGEEAPDEFALAEAEERYTELKGRIEALGPVNPQALEEYQETQQRYDFLNEQRQDLLDSIRDTEKAIRDIDTETRKRFGEAFQAINANFRETFATLFGGGVGEMRLTDESNLAESGIDIVASPPGKRLQNVLLLSGGEKALTALALLMAIFRYQPSPFCVLDEVDAPLDEPNIERLLRLLREMSGRTQFIMITHAKRTMEAAEFLYGVTMQEPGVSKLVTVRLREMAPPPQATAQAVAT